MADNKDDFPDPTAPTMITSLPARKFSHVFQCNVIFKRTKKQKSLNHKGLTLHCRNDVNKSFFLTFRANQLYFIKKIKTSQGIQYFQLLVA